MPDIAPFRGLRFDPDQFGDVYSDLIAPPYDVLDADDKAALIAKHPKNIVSVDLPHIPPKSAGPVAVYDQSANTLMFWRNDGTMMQEEKPALYVYHQTFSYEGKTYTRKKFFARMRLEEFGSGTVFPHEKTFGGPKEDRMMLMTATHCQISSIFGLFSDPDNTVMAKFDVDDKPANITATLDGVDNKVRAVTDATVIDAVRAAMADKPVYIADGHHRYGTAVMYRDAMKEKLGSLPEDHAANYVFIGLCAMEDAGCLILPTHRTISSFGDKTPDDVLAALQKGMTIEPATVNDPEKLVPAEDADFDLGIYVADGDKMYTGKFTQRDVLKTLSPDESDAWRSLDLAYMHRYLIDECVAKETLNGAAPTIAYLKQAAKAIDTARETNGIALLSKACTMEQMRRVSHAGDLMPQKSTYFYPKLATGLVLNPLD